MSNGQLHIEVTYESWRKTSVKMYEGLQTCFEKIISLLGGKTNCLHVLVIDT